LLRYRPCIGYEKQSSDKQLEKKQMTLSKTLNLFLYTIFSVFILTACSDPAQPVAEKTVPAPTTTEVTTTATPEPPPGQLNDSVAPRHYTLELKIDPSKDTFTGKVAIDVTFSEPIESIFVHGKNLDVAEAWLSLENSSRIEASYEQQLESGVALVSFAEPVAAGTATLHFNYSAPFNTSVNALFKVVRGEESYVASQFEPTGARQLLPGFDQPGFKVPFDLTLITRADDVVITNTPEASSETLSDGFVRHVFETTRPLPTYLLAFAVGPYDLVDFGMIPANSVRDREVALRGVTAKGLGERMHYALKNTDGILTKLEEYFGTPYPYKKLDLIAVPESFGGAMENPGAITYDEYLVLLDENSPADQRRAYVAVHAHELAHQWFGDLVTPVWWNDIWLNEAFATWMGNKAAAEFWAEGEFGRSSLRGALGAMDSDSLAAARQIREPVNTTEAIGDAFDGITYQKGGGVLAMLERYVGEEEFRDGVRLHMERHTDQTATAEDFMASLAEGSGRAELIPAFESFIEQPGVPLVSASVNCDDEQNPMMELSQGRYAPLGSSIDPDSGEWQIPVCVSYNDDGAKKSTCAMLNERSKSIKLDSNTCPSGLHPNADGAGYYRFSMDESWWDGLIADLPNLPASEALVLADSLGAAFGAGKMPAQTYVSGLATLINHQAWDVVNAAMVQLEALTDIVPIDQLEAVEKAFREMVQPRYIQLAGASDFGSELLQQRMQRFLIVMAKDQEMRKPLAIQAAARIGLNGDADPLAVDVDEMETVLSVGVQDLGEPFFDLLLEQAKASEDPTFRGAAIGSLARVEDPALVLKLQAALMNGDFKGTEAVRVIFRQMARLATTEQTYAWIIENDEAVIEMIPEAFRPSTVPALGGAFCSIERADEWQAFVLSHADKLAGYERSLAQTIESVQLCAAIKEAKGNELVAAFSSR
jgi:aminopeptidase N